MGNTQKKELKIIPDLPLLIFDGDCGFCKRCVGYIEARMSPGTLFFISSESLLQHHPEFIKDISSQADAPPIDFNASVYLIKSESGTHKIYSGAAAVFESLYLAKISSIGRYLYTKIPGFKTLSEKGYSWVARHRRFVSTCISFLGKKPSVTASILCLRGVGLVYVLAFLSLVMQAPGLYGTQGILPIQSYAERLSISGFGVFPSLFLWNASDAMIQIVGWTGVVMGGLLALGILPWVSACLCWIGYLSFVVCGQVFMGFQWDALLLEIGFLMLFLAPVFTFKLSQSTFQPSRIIVFLLKLVLFRLMFTSGLVKLMSGDPLWANLSSLNVHFWTQPLPHMGGWIADGLWESVKKLGVLATFFIELIIPWMIWFPKRFRLMAWFCINGLMVTIFLTGNYGFFNILVMVLSLILLDGSETLDDSAKAIKSWWRKGKEVGVGILAIALVVNITLLEYRRFVDRSVTLSHWTGPVAPIFESANTWFQRYHIYSAYGLFAVMTQARQEIIIYGSNDGQTWLPYRFKWKPQDTETSPKWVQPHQPRLDWQLWFAALSSAGQNPWIYQLLTRLLQGSEPVLQLFAENPFPDKPPKFIQAITVDFEFSNWDTLVSKGEWWKTGQHMPYTQPLYLK